MTYTPSCHLLSLDPGLPDDWTLGAAQLAWLEQTLTNATAKWRFTFIHHTVGGKAGNDIDSAYGRGGGQAACVGEQATVHDMLMRHGVQIFFYAPRPRVHGHGGRRHPLHVAGQRRRTLEVHPCRDRLHQLLAGFRIWSRQGQPRRASRSTSSRWAAPCISSYTLP